MCVFLNSQMTDHTLFKLQHVQRPTGFQKSEANFRFFETQDQVEFKTQSGYPLIP